MTVKFGPLVDAADGVTPMTALTIAQADIRLSKNGGNIAQSNNAAGAAHDELGYYDIPLDTTDTNTLGTLRVAVHETGALPVWQDFMVVPANVWDSFFGADALQVHVNEMTAGIITAAAIATNAIDADALAADAIAEINATVDTAISDAALATAAALATVDSNVDTLVSSITTTGAIADAVWDEARGGHTTAGTYGESFRTVVSGAAVTGTLSTTQMTTDLAEATDDHFNGRILIWTSGALLNQATDITDYAGSNGLLTFTAVTEAPSAADTFIIV